MEEDVFAASELQTEVTPQKNPDPLSIIDMIHTSSEKKENPEPALDFLPEILIKPSEQGNVSLPGSAIAPT